MNTHAAACIPPVFINISIIIPVKKPNISKPTTDTSNGNNNKNKGYKNGINTGKPPG
jgi:hypothetical protein